MILERAFPVSSILLAAIGFLGLLLTGGVPGGLILLGRASLVVSVAQAMELAGGRLARQIANLSSATWNVFLIAVFVFFGADLLLISRDILPAAVHFLILLMSIKLFHLRQRKDFLQLYAISFLELLAAAALTVDLWYAGVFIAYVVVAIWTLILYHLRNEAEEERAAGQAGKGMDGRSWANRLAARRLLGRTPDGGFLVPSELTLAVPESAVMRQEILIEALDTTVLFGASFVESVKGNFVVVQMNGMRGLYVPFPTSARFQYSVRSIPSRLLEADRTALSFTYPTFIREHYLQLPDTSQRVAAFAREVTSAASTPYGRARAIEQHLRRSYQYSLDVGTTVSADPVDDFLFTRKTGYCEHYATAMVVLLRTLGIPARLVTGFLPGVWNDFGNYYTIRQQDAHAWVEVYFPRSGWVTFAPTPSVPAAVPSWVWWNIGGDRGRRGKRHKIGRAHV